MKKSIVLLVALSLVFANAISAKNTPSVEAKLPNDFKQEIIKHIDYPRSAQEKLIEGEVWMRVTLDNNSKVEIVDMSATNPALGKHVQNELTNLSIENTSFKNGNIYYVKVKFELTE